MTRFASVVSIAFACAFTITAARAQDAAELLTRIDRLESMLRQLTGSVEQLQYRNQQLEQQVRRLEETEGRADVTRPSVPPRAATQSAPPPSVAATPPTASTAPTPPVAAATPVEPTATASSGGRRSDAFDPNANPNAPGAPRPLGSIPNGTAAAGPPPYERPPEAPAPGPRQLGAPLNLSTLSSTQTSGGQLPAPPPSNPNATGALSPTLPPSNSPKDQYDLAYGYVLHKDYGLAAEAFRSFLRQYPSDRQAPEAQYWLGESLFQQQQYRDAAEAFLAVSTKYETTNRAPEALLRLGQSLAALGEKEAACASLGEVLRKYPRAPQNVKLSVEREQKRAHC
jgi:tol-pal system protein YbgF